jgi:ABC-type hemin transport system ATPase subunit
MLGGGLPAATMTALVGPSGAGKTTLGLQFLSGSSAAEPVLSALAPASIAGRMKVEIFQAACNTLRTVAV